MSDSEKKKKRARKWQIQGRAPGGPGPPLFLDQTEARRAKKKFLGDRFPPFLRVWMTGPTPLSQGLYLALQEHVRHFLHKICN